MKDKRYKKFNNIQGKLSVIHLLGRSPVKEDYADPSFQQIKKTVLRHNLRYGLDSISHNELEGYRPTLGFELETVSGRIPDELIPELNIKAVHDGSLRDEDGEDPMGGEYVTGILYGDSGFKHLYDICKVLNDNTRIDGRAGVHVHIGNLNWNNEDILYAYILAQKVESEMFKMLPKSRSKNEYCRKINVLFGESSIKELLEARKYKLSYEATVDMLYEQLFVDVSGGLTPGKSSNRKTNHPRGSKCGYDKKSQRYCWINFVTLIFNTKGPKDSHTLEIRSHSATLNYRKIKNWTKIWVAFCEFVNSHKEAILTGYFANREGKVVPVNLETISEWAYPKSGKKLVEYIQARKALFITRDESVDFATTTEPARTIKDILTIN